MKEQHRERLHETFGIGGVCHRLRRLRWASGLRRQGGVGLVPRDGPVDNREQLREQEMKPDYKETAIDLAIILAVIAAAGLMGFACGVVYEFVWSMK
jgi:hypothetical protein